MLLNRTNCVIEQHGKRKFPSPNPGEFGGDTDPRNILLTLIHPSIREWDIEQSRTPLQTLEAVFFAVILNSGQDRLCSALLCERVP